MYGLAMCYSHCYRLCREWICERLTLQDLSLTIRVFRCALQSATVFEVEHDAVGKLLPILIRDVGRIEFLEGEALGLDF